uniref:Proteasomal ubiquitin receptor ADRM1 homolog n=1 Tax=Pristionchus pacificus TaxID=54126 RepID=A0A8R1UFE8_PRIPA
MFANTPRAAGGNNGYLVEFKAGRSNIQPGATPDKRKVVADKTKGLVFIKQSDDRLMHFCWKNRETGTIVDDLIIFPGDTEFMRIKECVDGKVFMLKFKSSDERRLFWLQEPAADADKNLIEKVNETLNNPPQGRSGRSGAGGSNAERLAAAAGAGSDDLASLGNMGNLGQEQLMQLLNLMGNEGNGAGGASPSATNTPQSNTEMARQLRSLINDMGRNAPSSDWRELLEYARGGASREGRPPVELSEVITGERVMEAVRNNQERLAAHLPATEGTSSTAELEATVRSPQFQQAADTFGHALQTGQLAPVFQQFGLPEETTSAAVSGDILEFAKKLTESEKKRAEAQEALAGQEGNDGEASNQNTEQPPAEQVTPECLKGPTPKRGKPSDDDQMDLD